MEKSSWVYVKEIRVIKVLTAKYTITAAGEPLF